MMPYVNAVTNALLSRVHTLQGNLPSQLSDGIISTSVSLSVRDLH